MLMHPHIIRTYDVVETPTGIYVVRPTPSPARPFLGITMPAMRRRSSLGPALPPSRGWPGTSPTVITPPDRKSVV